jgi:hypothetical protein
MASFDGTRPENSARIVRGRPGMRHLPTRTGTPRARQACSKASNPYSGSKGASLAAEETSQGPMQM